MLMANAYPKMAPAPTMPPGLVELMEDLTKEVLRNSPTDVYDFCAHHMKKLLEIRDGRRDLAKQNKSQIRTPTKVHRGRNNTRVLIDSFTVDGIRAKTKPITLEQRIARAKTNIRKRIEERYFKLRDVNLEPSDEQQNSKKALPETKVPIHQEKSLQDGEEIEILPKVTSDNMKRELIKNIINDDDEPKTSTDLKNYFIADTDDTLKSDEHFETIAIIKHSDEIINPETIDTTTNKMTEKTDQNQDEEVFVKEPMYDALSKDKNNDLIEAKQDLYDNKKHDDSQKIEIFNEPLNAYFTETAITPDSKDIEADANLNKHISADNSLHGSIDHLKKQNENNIENESNKRISETANALEGSNKNLEKQNEPMVQDVSPEYRSEEGIEHGENINLIEVNIVNDESIDLITQVEDLHVNMSTESQSLETHSSNEVENTKEKINFNLDTDQGKVNETIENLQKPDTLNTKATAEDYKTTVKETNFSESKDSNSQENNSKIELNDDWKSEESKSIVDSIFKNEDKEKNVPSKEIEKDDSENSYIGKFTDHHNTKASFSEFEDSDNKSVENLPMAPSATNIDNEENGETENKINLAQSEDTSKDCELVATVKTKDGQFVNEDADREDKVFTHSGIIEMSTNKDDNEVKEYDVTKDDKSDFGSTISDISSTHVTMNLETAAITIQKVFRNFLFKSRASTFDDAASDESNTLEKEFKDGDFSTLHQPIKDRRPPGLGRMDTVLQTVNEEKSLSLSTDDSSTISSAATIIQAHVRGFLARNKWNSSKTASSNSLQNSNPSNPVSTEIQEQQNKRKTVLNIHIVPENGHFISRDDSVLASIDLSLDGSPPTSTNLHPHDVSERRKLLKREDAIQSISPPSNNSGKLSEDAESVKELPLHELKASNNLTINDKYDLGSTKDENTNASIIASVDTVLHNNAASVIKDSGDENAITSITSVKMQIDNAVEKLDEGTGGNGFKKYNSYQNTDELAPSDHDTLENKSYNQSSETTPTSSITSDTVIEVKKDINNRFENNKIFSGDVALVNKTQSFNNEGFDRDILIKDDVKETTVDTEHDTIDNVSYNGHSKATPTTSLTSETVNKDQRDISNTLQSNQTNVAGDVTVPINETNNDTIENISHSELSKVTPKTSLTSETVNEVKRDISNTLTNQTNDARDVIVPIREKKSEIAICAVEPKLLHSGEFHDIVLPTKVSRNETSVIREFKNVVVYFLLWNNA